MRKCDRKWVNDHILSHFNPFFLKKKWRVSRVRPRFLIHFDAKKNGENNLKLCVAVRLRVCLFCESSRICGTDRDVTSPMCHFMKFEFECCNFILVSLSAYFPDFACLSDWAQRVAVLKLPNVYALSATLISYRPNYGSKMELHSFVLVVCFFWKFSLVFVSAKGWTSTNVRRNTGIVI